MINLKDMLMEDRSNQTARKGCLMAMIPEESSKLIVNFTRQLINEQDLYVEDNEYGLETEGHVTIRYGFLKDLNELEIRQLLQGQKPFMMEIYGLDKFDTHPNYDVAMFKVSSPVLRQLHEISGIYLNKSDYPDYNPHLTLAYVQKGKFNRIKEGLRLKVPVTRICYSPISGGKSYFNLSEGNIHHDIDSKIARLEQEWERLDSTGSGRQRQMEIEQELVQLRMEKENQPLNPEDPKAKELWAKLRGSI